MRSSFYRYLLVLAFLLFYGCQDILECVINRHPELPNKALDVAQTDSYYFEEIQAQIKNEPRDNAYDYYFTISHDLPLGLEVYVDYRSVIIEGYPLGAGQFYLDIDLHVVQFNDYYDTCESEFNNCDGLCKETTFKSYRLTIL